MSVKIRRAIAFWFLLLFGCALLIIQGLKYYNNQPFSSLDWTVFAVAILLVLAPSRLIQYIERVFKKKNESNG